MVFFPYGFPPQAPARPMTRENVRLAKRPQELVIKRGNKYFVNQNPHVGRLDTIIPGKGVFSNYKAALAAAKKRLAHLKKPPQLPFPFPGFKFPQWPAIFPKIPARPPVAGPNVLGLAVQILQQALAKVQALLSFMPKLALH